jgi:hypothetical protein
MFQGPKNYNQIGSSIFSWSHLVYNCIQHNHTPSFLREESEVDLKCVQELSNNYNPLKEQTYTSIKALNFSIKQKNDNV